MLIPLLFQAAPLPFLSPAFGSHMVLRRDRPNTFWGWTDPGAQVTVTIESKKATAFAGADGKWSVAIDPPPVGGPYTVMVDGSQHVKLEDVLVGDVWLCTGQSNMEFGLSLENNGPEEVDAAKDPNLRLFIVPHQVALSPMAVNGGTWKVCTPENVLSDGWGGFSAVGYHFGKALRREVGVPIGLVQDVWGGTNAESWTSKEGLMPLGDFDPVFPQIEKMKTAVPEVDAGDAGQWQNPETDVTGWKAVPILTGFHELGLGDFDGTAWFRKDFVLTAEQAAQAGAVLSLGAIDDNDVTWVNGTQVGAIQSYNTPRNYAIPAGLLHAGQNSLVVKVTDTGAFGGFSGPGSALALKFGDGTSISMLDGWLGHRGAAIFEVGPNVPTTLFNGMVNPEIPLGITGAIWYQGENNAGRAVQYRKILPAMIADWRTRFGQGDFPFYIVSLANFQDHKDTPGDDEWAELREAQAMTAANVKNSGLALAIDIGDAKDIHPKEKKVVGERLALIALAKTYGKNVVYQGPTYAGISFKNGEAVLKFTHADGGLVAKNGPLGEFQIAGADHKWFWGKARIEGDTVIVSSPDVKTPYAVRYAWQSNPVATLYNGAGLPAVPFRTDDWRELTFGRK